MERLELFVMIYSMPQQPLLLASNCIKMIQLYPIHKETHVIMPTSGWMTYCAKVMTIP